MVPDPDAGESIYSATLPSFPNRTLVRYRIQASDKNGATVQVPYSDDPSLNFAYFVYNGVPEYTASQRSVHPDGVGHVYPRSVMTSLPVYHLITDPSDHSICLGYGNTKIPKSNKASRSAFHWHGTFVYEGVVYDHIRYRLRQANDRYGNINGKRSMRFKFNYGNLFQARDLSGKKFPNKLRTINTGKMFDNKDVGNFGITETMNSLLWNMVDVPAPHTWWFHFRVIKAEEEQPDQYHGDFQGFQIVFENYDGKFLKTHKMPDGNLYKLKDGVFDGNLIKRHQGTRAVQNDSDFQNIRRNLRPERSASWLHNHVNYDKAYRYHAVVEAVRHYDFRPSDTHSKNRAWFFEPHSGNPLGRLWTLPWDSDASWGPNWNTGVDYTHNAAIVANGGKPDFVRDYRNFLREFRDLLWTEEVINPMIDQLADHIREMVPADRDRWKNAPSSAGRQDFGTMEWKVQDMKNFAFEGWTGLTGPDVPSGGRAQHLDFLALDAAIPFTPTLSYFGPPTSPIDQIQLQSSDFKDPQGNHTFGAIQWRIAEVAPISIPFLVHEDKPQFEWFADWDSGLIETFSSNIRVPAKNLKEGRTYRARVRHQDESGRWSHWSEPIEITPGPPMFLATLQQNLAISEIHYAPQAPSEAELLAGYTSSDFEFIELKNTGSGTLDLSNVRFTKGVDLDFPPGTNLGAGETVLIVSNKEAFELRHGTGLSVAGVFEGKLDNSGENLKLSLGAGIVIQELKYDNQAPWPNKIGHSIVLSPLSAGTLHESPLSWQSSPVPGGTPGTNEHLEALTAEFYITEFMANNRSTLQDGSGEHPDWIELHNPSNATAELSGWSLTDNPDSPPKWTFPDGTEILPGQRLLIFASRKEQFPSNEIHTSFKLSSSKDSFLALVNPEGKFVQMFHDYPEQRPNFSYGLANDEGMIRFFQVPTPGQPNGAGVLGLVEDTKFSHDRGFFDRPFEVEIKTATQDASIYYTLNGSLPYQNNGTLYTGPIPISQTTTLRAIAIKSGHVSTNVDTHTYLFPSQILRQPNNPAGFPTTWNGHPADYGMDAEIIDDPQWRAQVEDSLLTVPTLSLVLDRDDFFHANQGIYPKGEGVEKPTSVELIHPDGSKGFQINGSVQIVGGSSVNRWKTDKLSMRLKFTSAYGPSKLKFPVFGEDAAQEFDTLVVDAHLNNVWTYGGGSAPTSQRKRAQYLRDQYISDLHRELGGDSPYGYSVHLYIDGLYWGLHTLHERPDDNFISHYRGGRPDDYDVIKHRSSTVVSGTNDAYIALVNAANLDLTIDSNYQQVVQMLDLDPFIDYMLLQFYMGNTDWGHQNWYASRHRTDLNRNWRYHNWDAEHTMESLNQNAVRRNNNGGPTRIHQQLKRNTEYRMLFADLAYKHLYHDGVLSPEKSAAFYTSKAANIEQAIIAESARWGDNQRTVPYNRNDWIAERDNLLNNYFPNRRDVVISQLRSDGAYPSLDPPSFSQRGGEIPEGFQLTLTATSGDIYYTLNGRDPRLKGGFLSPSARKYTSAITFTTPSAIVVTRAKLSNEWSAMDQTTFIVEPALPTSDNLSITEILYEPVETTPAEEAEGFQSSDFEFIELRNLGSDKSINLDGLQFTSGIQFAFPPGIVLDPGENILVVANIRAFESRYGQTANIAGEFSGKLNNGGETLRLLTSEGAILQNFKYDNSTHWPAGADGFGKSLIRKTLDDQPDSNIPTGWKPSVYIGGSPGEEEPPPGTDSDSDGLPDEWESQHFIFLSQSHHDDFDNDGLPNLLEYTLNSNPKDPNSRNLPQIHITPEGHLTLTWSTPAPLHNLNLQIQASNDLQTWLPAQTTTLSQTTQNGVTTTTIQDDQPLVDQTSKFLRLVITNQ